MFLHNTCNQAGTTVAIDLTLSVETYGDCMEPVPLSVLAWGILGTILMANAMLWAAMFGIYAIICVLLNFEGWVCIVGGRCRQIWQRVNGGMTPAAVQRGHSTKFHTGGPATVACPLLGKYSE